MIGLIIYSSATHSGKVHDKALADTIEMKKTGSGAANESSAKKAELLADSGFLGYKNSAVSTILPHKKPKGGELTSEQRLYNRKISQRRVKVENVIGSIKILRILKDRNRNWREGFRDSVFQTGVALHNFKLLSHEDYKA